MRNRRILLLRYPRTTCYIGFCLLLFAGLVTLVCRAWPSYFAGGEPLSREVLDAPIAERILAEGQAFRTRYCLFCGASALAALLFYLVFNGACLHDHESFRSLRYPWRACHLLSFAVLLLAVWGRFFSLSGGWWMGFEVGLAALMLLALIGAFLLIFIRPSKARRPWLPIFDGLVCLAADTLHARSYQTLWKLLHGTLTLPTAAPVGTYRIVMLPQLLMAAVPLLPLLMLLMWSTLCLPRLLGERLLASTRTSFICLEKRG